MKFLSIVFFLLINQSVFSQCIVESSNNDYEVWLTVYPISLSNIVQTGGDCTFTTEIYYDIEITGTNPPNSMYTLQGRVHCAGQNRTFDLPNNGGIGVSTSANGSAPYINGNCSQYSEADCDDLVIIIQGPNIPYQEVLCSGFSPAPPPSNLPTEIVSFNGQQVNGLTELNFTSASERNNDYFTIERLENNKTWTEVKRLQGQGNSNKEAHYSALVDVQNVETSYYRLSQTDYDGTTSRYGIIAVKNNSLSDLNYTIYPNPAVNNTINIRYNSDNQSPVSVNTYSIQGQLVKSSTLFDNGQNNVIVLPFQKGQYIVELIQNSTVVGRKMIINQ